MAMNYIESCNLILILVL